jgi:ATP adenylyltransferase
MADKNPDNGCLFCGFVEEAKDRENFILARGEHWYVIINRYPYTTGHVMVVCNRHVEGFSPLNREEKEEMADLVGWAKAALRSAYSPDGINVGANLGQSAGAGIVGHLHIHLVPRWHGDTNFMSSVGETRVVSEDLNDTYDRVLKAMEETK